MRQDDPQRLHLLFILLLSGVPGRLHSVAFPRPQRPAAFNPRLAHLFDPRSRHGWLGDPPDTDWLRGLEEGGASDRIEVVRLAASLTFCSAAVQAYDHTRAQARYLAEKITESSAKTRQARIRS